jgi:hypothetical protein
METNNSLSELGEWKNVECYPNYRISSTGAVMNKRTLKILKHFRYEATQEPSVTLYRAGISEVLSVRELLQEHFPGVTVAEPERKFKKGKFTQTQDADLFLDD